MQLATEESLWFDHKFRVLHSIFADLIKERCCHLARYICKFRWCYSELLWVGSGNCLLISMGRLLTIYQWESYQPSNCVFASLIRQEHFMWTLLSFKKTCRRRLLHKNSVFWNFNDRNAFLTHNLWEQGPIFPWFVHWYDTFCTSHIAHFFLCN